MPRPNTIIQIGFPDSLNQGFEIVVGTRTEKYLEEHPNATDVEAYEATN